MDFTDRWYGLIETFNVDPDDIIEHLYKLNYIVGEINSENIDDHTNFVSILNEITVSPLRTVHFAHRDTFKSIYFINATEDAIVIEFEKLSRKRPLRER